MEEARITETNDLMSSANEQAAGIAARRQAGMEAVITAFQALLIRYAARLINNPAAAQDIVQNVFIKLFQQWQPGMQPDARLKNWLFRVTHNEAVDFIRAEARRNRLHDEHAEVVTRETGGVHADPPADEREAVVLRCLNVLDPGERQVVLLRLQQGMSYEEISAVTGQSVGYVGNRLHFAVKRLAMEVRRQEGGVA